jgi:DNA polymerase
MSAPLIETLIPLAERYLEYQRDQYGPELYLQPAPCSASSLAAQKALDEFRLGIQNCKKCALSKNKTRFVFGAGNPNANLMLIGEAPGAEEDRQGEPFVGADGQLLDKILASIGFERGEVYLCNVLKCRRPAERDPLPDEIGSCISYLHKQIEMTGPKVVLVLGLAAARCLLKTQTSPDRLRGEWHDLNGIPLLATYHPSELLRNPERKRPVWEDVQKLRKLYDERVGDKPEWNPSRRKTL